MTMKALIRSETEVVKEDCGLSFIDWNTGYPLTDAKWFGGPYNLVQNYVPPVNGEPAHYEEIMAESETEHEVQVTEETVIIDGKTYTKAELRALLGE